MGIYVFYPMKDISLDLLTPRVYEDLDVTVIYLYARSQRFRASSLWLVVSLFMYMYQIACGIKGCPVSQNYLDFKTHFFLYIRQR